MRRNERKIRRRPRKRREQSRRKRRSRYLLQTQLELGSNIASIVLCSDVELLTGNLCDLERFADRFLISVDGSVVLFWHGKREFDELQILKSFKRKLSHDVPVSVLELGGEEPREISPDWREGDA